VTGPQIWKPRLVPNVGETVFTGKAEKNRKIARRLRDGLPADFDPSALLLVHSAKSQNEHFQIFPRSLHHKRPSLAPPKKNQGCRHAINHFSKKSQRSLRHVAVNSWPALVSQFMLSYHLDWPTDGRQVKRHLNLFLTRLRQARPDLRYLWVLEFQERGAPHFHLFLSELPTAALHDFLASTWVKVTDPGNAAALAVHSHHRNFIKWDMGSGAYVAKYLEKQGQKQIPPGFENVGRFYGSSRGSVPLPVNVYPEHFEAAATDRISGEITVTWKQAVRWLGRWDQARLRAAAAHYGQKARPSRFLTSWQSARLWLAASVYCQIENYAIKQREVSQCASAKGVGSSAAVGWSVPAAVRKWGLGDDFPRAMAAAAPI